MANAPARDEEAEEGLLGCALLGAFEKLSSEGVTADLFTDPKCKLVWDAMASIIEKGGTPSEPTIAAEWGPDCDVFWLGGLAGQAPTEHNWSYWLPRVKEVSARQRIWDLCHSVAAMAGLNADPAELQAQLEAGLLKYATVGQDVVDSAKEGWRQLCDILAKAGTEEATGLLSGINSVDKAYGGFRRATMNTVAGRPGTGKSALAANIVHYLAHQGARCLVFTAEMPAREYESRLLAIDSEVDVQGYLKNAWPTDATKLASSIERMSKLPISIVDDPSITATQMRAYARKMAKSGLDMVVVDYLQLYRSGRKTSGREEEVAEVSKAFKQLALECDVPVIVLSQMNRDIEKTTREPKLSDLRESGSIEQDSDTVGFLQQEEECMKLYVKKNRNGSQGIALIEPVWWCQKFKSFSPTATV